MIWIDIAGRWLVIGLGLAAGVFILVIAWAYCLSWFVNVTQNTKHLYRYIVHRKEFHQWWDERNKNWPDRLSEEEKQQLRERVAKRGDGGS
jgi:hypothetical protein